MTDWNSLKVADLKAELKRRGLAVAGLKAALVARLEESDAEQENGPDATEAEANGARDEPAPAVEDAVQNAEERAAAVAPSEPERAPETAPVDVQTEPVVEPAAEAEIVEPVVAAEPVVDAEPVVAVTEPEPAAEHVEQSAPSPTVTEQAPPVLAPSSDLPPVAPEEAAADQNKRKRRSQSPVPRTEDLAQKRARHEVPLPSDEASLEPTLPAEANESAANNGVDNEMQDAGGADTEMRDVEGTTEQAEKSEVNDVVSNTDGADEQLASKHEQKDSRYKDIFGGPQSSATDMRKEAMDIDTERTVAPAIHPATSSLYIRDFQRPLNMDQLKSHLISLAAAPGTTPDPDVIVDFFLDPIRTHAFVTFSSTSAASRVRSEMHDRVWPDEKNRKPLWADFVPDPKVSQWIGEEEEARDGPRTSKKWEIVYGEDRDGNISTTLSESGLTPAQMRKPSVMPGPPAAGPFRGLQHAPTGPRGSGQVPTGPRSSAPLSHLDNLFKSTVTRPVLYYQPVSKELANNRLDAFDAVTSKSYSSSRLDPDINRYTFEDGDVLVDRGREIFEGIRPPHREPGGGRRGGGGFGGPPPRGGGGYRGDAYYPSRDGDRRGPPPHRRY